MKEMMNMDRKTNNKLCKVLREIFNMILTVFIIIAIISLSTLTLQKIIFKNEVPNLFGFKLLQVMSGSMSGTFEVGDVILIKDVKNSNQLQIGDVITYKIKDSLITHRIIDITKVNECLEFTTKGDSNNSKDEKNVDFYNIEGKFIIRIPFIGVILSFMQKTFGMTIIIILPVLVILFLIFQDRKRERKQNLRREKRLRYEFEEKRKVENKTKDIGKIREIVTVIDNIKQLEISKK